jgi:hypothetical protein
LELVQASSRVESLLLVVTQKLFFLQLVLEDIAVKRLLLTVKTKFSLELVQACTGVQSTDARISWIPANDSWGKHVTDK